LSSVFEQPQTTKKRGGRQPGRALRYAKGFARGLLHHPVGHYPGRRTDVLSTAEKEELRRLRRENRQLRQERDILSKAAAWFAQNDSMSSRSSNS